jgi:hypothetical protein
MKNIFFITYLIVLFLVIESNSITVDLNNQVTTDFDYLIFRQIWPEATCMFPGKNKCTIGKNVSSWVVHGLWY